MDKIKSLYESYIAEGVISPSTTLEQFTSANEEQQSTLYNQGIQANVLSQETGFDLFKSAWDLKKKEDTELPSPVGSLEQQEPVDVQEEIITAEQPEFVETTTIEKMAGGEPTSTFFGDIARAWKQGSAQAGSVDEAFELFFKGKDVDDEDVDDFIKAVQVMDEVPQTKAMKSFYETYEKEGSDIYAFFAGLEGNLAVLPQLFISSARAMANPESIMAATGSAAVAGIASGGTLALPAAIAGLSGSLETALSFTEGLKKELGEKDFTRENVKEILENPVALSRIRNKAIARGAVIGGVDAITLGLSSKLGVNAAKLAGKKGVGTTGKALAATAGAGVGEAIGGGTGEAVAQVVTGEKLDAANILFETFTGTVGGPLAAGKALYSLPKYRIGNVNVTREKFIESIDKANAEEILTMEVGIKNDEEVSAIMDSKFKDATIEKSTKEVVPNISDESLSEIIKLTKRKEILEANGQEAAKVELPKVNKQIKDIIDAVQESSTEKVDVRQQPTDGEGVGVGDITEPTTEITPQEETVAPTDQEITEEADVTELTEDEKLEKVTKEKVKKLVTAPRRITEPFIVPTKKNRPSNTQINFTEDGKIESVVNKETREPVSDKTRKAAEKLYLESLIDVNDGKFTEYQEGVTEERANQFVAENSQNVREIAEAIEREKNSIVNQRLEFDEADVLYDIDGYFTIEDIAEVWDERLINENSKSGRNIRRYWTRPALDKFGRPNLGIAKIDTKAQELGISVEALKEIIIDYPTRNINRPEGFSRAVAKVGKTDALIDLENKFEKLTGLKATDTNINTVLDIDPNRPPLTEEKKLSLIEREQAIVESEGERVIKGKKVSAEQVVGGKPKEVTVEEIKALKDQIRLEARAAREAKLDVKKKRAAINDLIKDFKGKGQITTAQSIVLARKINSLNVDNEVKVEEFIDYADKIIKNAELADKIRNAENLRGAAKKNITRKIGSAKDLFPALQTLLNIKPAAIPLDKIDSYLSLAESFGAKKAVLTLPESGLALQQAEDIINSIEEKAQKETAKPKKEKKYKLKEEIDKIISNRIDVPSLPKDEKKIAEFLNSLSSEDIEALVTEKDGKKSYSNVEKLKNVLANIENGYLTKAASELQVEIEANRNSKIPTEVFKKLKYKGLEQFIERGIAKLKTGLKGTERDILREQIRAVPLTNVDEALGHFNKKDIARATFDPMASAHQKYETDLGRVGNLLREADGLLGKGRIKFTTRLANKVIKSKYKIMTYQLQREYNSNDGKKGTAPAIEFIDRTIEAIEKGDIKFIKERDAKILNEIKQEFEVDGNIDIDKLENSFTPNEKKALDKIDQANQSLAEKALFTSAVLRGNRVNLFNNYVHHDVLMNSEEAADNLISKQKRFTQPSTKSQTLLERTPGAKPISFDPIASAGRAAKETLLDYHMTQPLRVVNKTISNVINNLESDPNSTKFQKGAARAVKDAFNEINTILFDSTFEEIGIAEKTLDNIKRLGYYSALASVPRAVSELGSNTVYALSTNPVGLARGVAKYGGFSLSSEGANVLDQIGSSQTLKIFSTEDLTGKQVDSSAFKRGRDKRGKALNPVFEKIDLLYNNLPLLKAPVELTKFFAEQLISTPDKAISRPLYFDTFVESFSEATKKSGKQINLTTKDLQEIGEGTSKYLTENQAEIEVARRKADDENIRMATTVEPYSGILKLQRKKGDPALRIAYKAANSYMARFNLFEYTTARKALRALYTSGDLTKLQAVGILAGVTARMTSYMLMYQALSTIYDEMLGNIFGLDVEEEKEEGLLNQFKRQLIGTGATLILRRGIGNIPAVPISLGIEYLNEKYGEDLREGEEYDEYENSLVFSNISLSEFREKPVENLAVKTFAGPYGPLTRSVTRAATIGQRLASGKLKEETKEKYIRELTERMAIEAAGNAGLLPFYKDIRRAYLKDFFKEPVKKSKAAKFTEEDLKKYKNNPAAQQMIRDRIRKQKKGKQQTSKLPGTKR